MNEGYIPQRAPSMDRLSFTSETSHYLSDTVDSSVETKSNQTYPTLSVNNHSNELNVEREVNVPRASVSEDDWNEEYQQLCELQESLEHDRKHRVHEKKETLLHIISRRRAVATAFTVESYRIIRMLVREKCLPNELKTIKPTDVDETTYIHGRLCFQFITDLNQIYGCELKKKRKNFN